jgi:hypothetical protein
MNTQKIKIKPDMTDPEIWLKEHRKHARPFYVVKIGDWHQWRCPCGQKFYFNDKERDAAPLKYMLVDK